ncbi:DUF5689 domain-containing protein [Parapedobacter deserti]|uniref:DUF5689 domain-containing protein n=1 Tax=Parapedobacter deserti TaxID=1912957 RepID=A0ABV7JSW1_9SPHI
MKRTLIALCGVLVIALGCDKYNPQPPNAIPNPYVTIQDIRELYDGQDLRITPDMIMKANTIMGIVVTDAASGNVTPGEVAVQYTFRGFTRGIALRLDGQADQFALGDSISIDVNGALLTRRNGPLALEELDASAIVKLGVASQVMFNQVSISELLDNFGEYESTLVKIVGANVINASDTYQGNVVLDDGSGQQVELYTDPDATFSAHTTPFNAEFSGIATLMDKSGQAVPVLRLRNEQDVQNASGPLYPIWPEAFETDLVKNAYAAAELELSTGKWLFDGVTLVTPTDLRRITGMKGVQFNQNNAVPLYLQMNFDLPDGASKVTIYYGSYGTDPGCEWQLEYSVDQGQNWTVVGEPVVTSNKVGETATFLMEIDGPVRFRVHKLALGSGNNGRMNMDDFAVYSSY